MTDGRILLTGAAGFVGRHVLETLRRHACGKPIRILVHETQLPRDLSGTLEVARGDLREPRSLHSVCERVDTLLHLAAYVGEDESHCQVVNGMGTEALVAAAREAGVQRILYLSNAAVYGYAVHRHATEEEAHVEPATAVSRSRARAERSVLQAGGIVLRPLFTYGCGDTRFIPVIMRALERFPFLIRGGRARLSVIAVEDLAAVIAELGQRSWSQDDTGPYHIDDMHPVTFREIVLVLSRQFGIAMPRVSVPYPVARWLARLGRGRIAGSSRWTDSSAHRLFLVAYDHYYDASRLWRRVAHQPQRPFAEQFDQYVTWYERFGGARATTHGIA